MPALAESTSLTTAHYINHGLQRTLAYAEKLLEGIPPEKFAYQPVANLNHPAFIVGHLALYPDRIFTLLDRRDLVHERAGWAELFAAGVACGSDASCFPAKDVLTNAFFDGYRKVSEILPGVDDAILQRPNPMEGRFREIFPHVGEAVNFLCNNHLMMHLGQISAWRRMIGLGSAM